jgi:hypothetical protein
MALDDHPLMAKLAQRMVPDPHTCALLARADTYNLMAPLDNALYSLCNIFHRMAMDDKEMPPDTDPHNNDDDNTTHWTNPPAVAPNMVINQQHGISFMTPTQMKY